MKKIAIVLLAALLCFSFCGCGVCTECNGEKTVLCASCDGKGEVKCPEKNCNDGSTGYSCTNCGGREGVSKCLLCDYSGKETRTCETCGGDGVIINPFTWESFSCNTCDGLGQAVYDCDNCKGYGLICSYCRFNSKNYPTEDYHPYLKECAFCSGKGTVRCDDCMGKQSLPCSACSVEEYEAFVSEQNEKNKKEIEKELIENAKTMLTGITKDGLSYQADPVDKNILQKTKDYLLTYEGSFEEKSDLLEKIEQIAPYVDSVWKIVDGFDTKIFFKQMPPSLKQCTFQVKYSRENEAFYIRVFNSKIFYATNEGNKVFEYFWDGDNEAYEVFLTKKGNLKFKQYEKTTFGSRTDVVIDSCELKKVK